MGRASRRKRERRAGETSADRAHLQRRVKKAELRGRTVAPTETAFAAVAARQPRRAVEALIARHNVRMENLAGYPDGAAEILLSALCPLVAIDADVRRLRSGSRAFPADWYDGGGWVAQVEWGADSCVSAVRLALCGQFVGAAAILRQQIERWTTYLSMPFGSFERSSGESIEDFILRCWNSYLTGGEVFEPRDYNPAEPPSDDGSESAPAASEPRAEHEHLNLSDGSEVCPGFTYAALCALLHGDFLGEGSYWSAALIAEPDELDGSVDAVAELLADGITLVLRVVQIVVAAMLVGRGVSISARRFLDRFSVVASSSAAAPMKVRLSESGGLLRVPPPESGLVRPTMATLMPLLPLQGLEPELVAKGKEASEQYLQTLSGQRVAGRLLRDDEITTLAFQYHRLRFVDRANRALERERELFGDDFDIDSLGGRDARIVGVCETAGLLALWAEKESEASIAWSIVCSGLRSAFWLWLEDDDRSVAVLRSVLERCAVLRTMRLKPEKASRLASNPRTTPSDWLVAAGWRRLSPLLRALSEFAHGQAGARWGGAWKLLADLQDEDAHGSIHTARGHALGFVTELCALELLRWGGAKHDAETADVLKAILNELGGSPDHTEDNPAWLELILNRIWAHRDASLGKPDLRRSRDA
jgi:hypothetical protein